MLGLEWLTVGPRIILPNRRIGQAIGRETILECTITASPQAVSYWQKDGRKIMNAVNAASASAAASRSPMSIAGGHGGASAQPTSPVAGAATHLQHTKYRIEAYDEGDYTLTLSLRLQVCRRQMTFFPQVVIGVARQWCDDMISASRYSMSLDPLFGTIFMLVNI